MEEAKGKLAAREQEVRAEVEREASLKIQLAVDEKEEAVGAAWAEAAEREAALREEWAVELTRAMEEKELLLRELRKREERPMAVAAIKQAQKELTEAMDEAQKPDLLGACVLGAPP